ncbi:MAG TPA: hypothetical protein VD772_03350, partial [Anseongella sp.]|nr:hypothetical protein [Anseongella sp.]
AGADDTGAPKDGKSVNMKRKEAVSRERRHSGKLKRLLGKYRDVGSSPMVAPVPDFGSGIG